MSTRRKFARRNRAQSGYALLLVVFLTALVLVASMSVGLRVYTEGKREKEKEMIWRGNQYVRGVKLYYRKLGRFPTSIDDLTKPRTGNIRFMRQAYRDPMNKEDGSWRLIYVGPAGQLIGSLKPRTGGIQMPNPGGQPAAQPPGTQPGANPPGTSPGTTPPGTNPPTPGSNPPGITPAPPGTNPPATDPNQQQVPTGDTPTIVGGNIIGVGSKINESSVIVYEQATNYRLFEFIWDPSKDLAIPGAQGTQVGTPNKPGQNPLGPGAPTNPPGMPPTNPPQNPNPNPQQP